MKRLALLPLMLLVFGGLGTPVLAQDSEVPEQGWSASGEILIPNPASRATGGLTEILSPCMGSADPDVPDGAFQGLDGHWVELPELANGLTITLTADGMNEVDGWFYDDSCALILEPRDDAYSIAGGLQDPPAFSAKEGTVPEFAAWVVVDLFAGANASFELEIPEYGAAPPSEDA